MKEHVLNQLEMTRSELLNEVRGLPLETLQTKPPGDGWSVLEIMEHLATLEGAVAKGLVSVLQSPERSDLVRAPLELLKDSSRKSQAPSRVQPAGKIHTLAEAEQALADARQKLLESVAVDLGTERMEKRGFEHPMFGPMSAAQWVELIPLHEDRHLGQIRNTLRQLQES
ncbi:DinB superfamily protein [Paenibacillaceae bacterium GAS479]|nr:DinB superfamily protein [Paenibacillaceae bacterium GAS479]